MLILLIWGGGPEFGKTCLYNTCTLPIETFFNFMRFWKMLTTDHPFGSDSDIFEIENILMEADLLRQTSKVAFLHWKRLKFIK